MVAAMYLRKSRAEENAPIDETLARHKETLMEYAAKNKIAVIAVYEEVASGDSLAGRPQMLKLLDELDRCEAVLCMDIDRLGRGTMSEQGLILDALKEANVQIVTPGKTYNLRDDMDDSLISFKALFAREEYKLIRGRLRRGVMKTIQEGGYVANAPYGYIKTRIKKMPSLAINEEEATAVRMIFDLYIEGKGCHAIAETLHTLGFRPHRSDKFNRTSVAAIIRNPVYIGKVPWNRVCHKRPKGVGDKHRRECKPPEEWLIVDGLHEPIIEAAKFEQANRIYKGRYHPPSNTGVVKNPLAGVLFCANCESPIQRMAVRPPKVKEPFMICPTKGCCMGCRQDVIEETFYLMLQLLLSNIETGTSGIESILDNKHIINAAKNELTKLTKQLDRLHDLLESGVYDVDTFLTRREELQRRINETDLIIKNTKPPPEKSIIVKKLKTLIDHYWIWEPSEKNTMIKEVIGRVIYEKPKNSGWKSPPQLRFISWSENL